MYPPQRMHILSLFTDHKGPESPSERQRENMSSPHTLPPLLPRLITPRLRDVVFKITSMAITAGCERTMLNGYRIPYTLPHSPPRRDDLGRVRKGVVDMCPMIRTTPSHQTRLSRASSHLLLLFRVVSSCSSSLNRITEIQNVSTIMSGFICHIRDKLKQLHLKNIDE